MGLRLKRPSVEASIRVSLDCGDTSTIPDDDVGKEVGQAIDKQLMRFSEILFSLVAGTLAVVIGLALDKGILHPLFRASLIVLGLSIPAGLVSLLAYLLALYWNPRYRKTQGQHLPNFDICRDKQESWKKCLKVLLSLQAVLFLTGEAMLFIKIMKHP